jgi:hypothetical protein
MPKPSKTPAIESFLSSNVGKSFATKDMCDEIGCSLPTLLNYIKANPGKFTQVSYGTYLINSDVTSITTINSASSVTDEEWENN